LTTLKNTHKMPILFFFFIFLTRTLLAQEQLTFVAEQDTVSFMDGRSTEPIAINAGDLVVTNAWVGYGTAGGNTNEFHLTIRFGEPGRWYWTRAKYFRPLNTEDVFGDDIFIDYPVDRWDPYARQSILNRIAIGDADAMWVPAYYRNILMGQSRDMLLEMEPTLESLACRDFLAGITDDGNWYDNTQADIQRGRAMFYNSVIRLGTATHLAVRNIRRTDFGYMVDSVISITDQHLRHAPFFLHGSAFWDSYRPGNAVTLLLHLDGDYLDIYTYGSDIHVTTLIRVGREFIVQYQSLIRTNTVDLTNVQWPRRADGSMSVVPPTFPPIAQEVYETTYAEIVEGEAPAYVEEFFEEQAPAAAEADSEESGTPPWTLIGVIGGAVIIAGGAALVVAKRKRA